MTGHRHEVLVRYKVTFDPEDGRILKSEFNAYSNAGHSIDLSLPWIIILLLRYLSLLFFQFHISSIFISQNVLFKVKIT